MLKELPRVKIANLPTPLHEVKRLSELLGGPKILFKRDDATGLVLGGQKARMLEYPFGDAIARGCDVVVTIGSEDSNLACQTAAAARRLGMDVVLVFLKRRRTELTGNALLINLLDPIIIQTPWSYAEVEHVRQKVQDVIADLKKHGRNPFFIDYEFWEPLGVVSLFYCVQEIMQQLEEMGETAKSIYVANAGGITQGGLIIGAKYFHAPFDVVGTMTIAGFKKEDRMREVAHLTNTGAELAGADVRVDPSEVILRDENIGEYWGPLGQATQEAIEAIRLVAKTEGIFLDPHYTGKNMASLLCDIRQGKFTSEDTVIFYLTGGAPIIFPYHDKLQIENRTNIEVLHR